MHVNFKQLKRDVGILTLMEHYGIALKKSGDTYRAPCPIHNGDNESSFSVWEEGECFHCFSCDAKGNIFDFVMAMEGIENVRESAIWVADTFGYAPDKPVAKRKGATPTNVSKQDETPHRNEPMDSDFEEKYKAELDTPELDGYRQTLLEQFDCGLAKKGIHRGKLVTPISNEHDELLCYAGLGEKSWKFPKGYNPGGDLYNLDTRSESLIIVSDIRDVWITYEAGWSNCIATVQPALSDTQLEILVEQFHHSMRVLLLAPPDFELVDAISKLGAHFYLKYLKLKQPLHEAMTVPF